MKFSLMSDLHLEFASLVLPGGDNLLLSGDIFVADYFRRNDAEARSNQKKFNKFIKKECAKYKQVFYIAGNHESYYGVYENTHDILRKALIDTNVRFLENESIDLGEIVLFGGTMWTDFRGGNPASMYAARSSMNDFAGLIRHSNDHLFTPDESVVVHKKIVAALRTDLCLYKDRKFLVMTHHAPSKKSLHPRYKGDTLNDAYSSDLSELILSNPNIKVFCHGHTHDSFDYKIGECKVIANPRGYTSEGSKTQENPFFDIDYSFEV